MENKQELPDINFRLISNIVVMGFEAEKENLTYERIISNDLQPRFLDCYPEINLEKIPPYLENSGLWCFPEGIRIFDENLNLLNENSELASYLSGEKPEPAVKGQTIADKDQLHQHFVMTDQNNVKRYCTSLLFHEKRYIRVDPVHKNKKERKSPYIPRVSLKSIVNNPLSLDDNHMMIYVPKAISLISYVPIFDAQKQILRYFYQELIKVKRNHQIERIVKLPMTYFSKFDEMMHQEGEESIDSAWEVKYPAVCETTVQNRKSTDKGKNELPTEDFSIRETHLLEFYLSSIFSLMEVTNESTETVLLKLYEDKHEELVRYRVNKTMGINLVGFSFKTLFKQLSLINIVRVIKHVILERQIIIFSSEPGEIANLTEAILLLVSPLSWCCIYVPYMPIIMWETLHAMMPYIVGIHRKYKKFILENLDTKDKILVDLDEDKIIGEERFLLPKVPKEYLFSKMDALLKPIENSTSNKEINWPELALKTRQNFSVFILMIINNYYNFFKPEPIEFDPSQPPIAMDIFDHAKYVSAFPKEDQPYMDELSKRTMMFNKFIEDSFIIIHNCEIKKIEKLEDQTDEISLLIKNLKLIDKMSVSSQPSSPGKKGGLLNVTNSKALAILGAEQIQHIRNSLFRYNMPRKVNLRSYLVKYLKFFNFSNENSLIKEPKNKVPSDKTTHEMLKSLDILKLNKENLLFPKLKKERIINIKEPFKKRAEKKKKIRIFSDKKLVSEQEGLEFMENYNQIESFADTLKKISPFFYYQAVTRNQNRFSTRPSVDIRRGSCFAFPGGNTLMNEGNKSISNLEGSKLDLRTVKSNNELKEKKAEVELHRLMGLPDIPALEFKGTKKGMEEEFKEVSGGASSRRVFQRKSDSRIPAIRKKMIFEGLGDLKESSEEDQDAHEDLPRRLNKIKTMDPTRNNMLEQNSLAFESTRGPLAGGKLQAQEFQGDIDKSPYTSPIRDKKRIFADDMQTLKIFSDKKKKKLYNQKIFDLNHPTSEQLDPNILNSKVISKSEQRKQVSLSEERHENIVESQISENQLMIKDINTGKYVPWRDLENELQSFKSNNP